MQMPEVLFLVFREVHKIFEQKCLHWGEPVNWIFMLTCRHLKLSDLKDKAFLVIFCQYEPYRTFDLKVDFLFSYFKLPIFTWQSQEFFQFNDKDFQIAKLLVHFAARYGPNFQLMMVCIVIHLNLICRLQSTARTSAHQQRTRFSSSCATF